MADTTGYRCPHCNGEVKFDIVSQKMVCRYCDSIFEISDFDEQKEEVSSAQEGERETWADDELKGMFVFKCSYCGGEIVGDENTSATTCPFCDMPVVLKERFAGGLKPDYIIPFKIKKDEAVKKLQEFCNGKKLLPKSFTENNRVESLKGMYVPFWVYDSKPYTEVDIEGSKSGKSWSDSSFRYTEVSVYSEHKAGSMEFKNVPVDASKKMDDNYMNSIEPFDYKDMIEFNSAYLAGYISDKYDEDEKTCENRAYERMSNTIKDSFLSSSSLSNKKITNININPNFTKKSYVLLPVWILSTRYNDTIYTYAMNGQTGKFIGKLPIDEKLKKKSFITTFGVVVAIGTIIMAIASKFVL